MKKHFPILMLALIMAFQTNAQDFPYFFSVQSATYTELTNDTVLEDLFSDPGDPWDDPYYVAPIGFSFDFMGDTSDSLYNALDVGASFTFASRLQDFYAPFNPLFAYGNDLMDRGYIAGIPVSPISYAVEGDAGSQIFKLQYKNAGFYYEADSLGTLNNNINLQVWLYEGSNDIEIHFGPSELPVDLSGIDDFSGPFIAFGDSIEPYNFKALWYLSGDAASPMVKSLTLAEVDTFRTTLNNHPANGTVYRFGTSPNVGVEELVHSESFKLFPTLVQDRVELVVSNDSWIGENAMMQLFDSQGRIVQQLQTDLEANMELEMSQVPAGIYFFTLSNESFHLTRKLIKL